MVAMLASDSDSEVREPRPHSLTDSDSEAVAQASGESEYCSHASATRPVQFLCAISSNIVQYWQYVQYVRTRAICTICTISMSILYTKLHAILSNMISNIMYNFDQYALLYCVQY